MSHLAHHALLAALAPAPISPFPTLTTPLAILRGENIQYSGTQATGWLDTVTNQVLAMGATYTATDSGYNGYPSVSFDPNSMRLPGVAVPAASGFTVTFVGLSAALGFNDSMWWSYLHNSDILDLFRADGMNLVLNSFNGSKFGLENAAINSTMPDIVTVRVPNGNSLGASFFLNGQQRTPVSLAANTVQDRPTPGTFYIGSVPPFPQYNYVGSYADFILQAGLPSDAEILALHAYFRSKYNLY